MSSVPPFDAFTEKSVADLKVGDWVQPNPSGDVHDPKQLVDKQYGKVDSLNSGYGVTRDTPVALTFRDGTVIETARSEPVLSASPQLPKLSADGQSISYPAGTGPTGVDPRTGKYQPGKTGYDYGS